MTFGERQPVFDVLLDERAIRKRVTELSREIAACYGDDAPLMVGVLNGAVIFMSDLVRSLPMQVDFEFMAVSSYGNAKTSSGEVRILKDLDSSIEQRRILLVEDIVDSGATLRYLLRLFKDRQPRDVKVVTLLRKPAARSSGIEPDWVGFDIPDVFVVGYGLDFAGKYRNLPYVAALQAD
jgi:hypoxanthine phosphoribosyltransferase